jgi:hypothetical protein
MQTLTATNNHVPHDDPDSADIPLPSACREFFALAERIQSVQGCDAMRAFYEAMSLRPDLYDRVAAAPAEEINEILAALERERDKAA